MSKLTKTALQAQIESLLPDNTTGEISAADMRKVVGDMVDSLSHVDGAGIIPFSTPVTITAAHNGAELEGNHAAGLVVTLPTDAEQAVEIGFRCWVTQVGAGAISFAGSATIQLPGWYQPVTWQQFSRVMVTKPAANTWRLSNGLAPIYEPQVVVQ